MTQEVEEIELEEAVETVMENHKELTKEQVKRLYLRLKEEANQRMHWAQYDDEEEAEREESLALAEGDLLARRRLVEDLLRLEPGDSGRYASLSIYRGDDYYQVKDVDDVSAGIVSDRELPDDDPERIEYLQEKLDRIHIESLAKL